MITGLLVLFVVLAAGNAFGQRPSSHTSLSPAATLTVSSPAHVRGGLIFQTRVHITAHTDIAAPTVMLSGGWFDGMTQLVRVPIQMLATVEHKNAHNRKVDTGLVVMGAHRPSSFGGWVLNPCRSATLLLPGDPHKRPAGSRLQRAGSSGSPIDPRRLIAARAASPAAASPG